MEWRGMTLLASPWGVADGSVRWWWPGTKEAVTGMRTLVGGRQLSEEGGMGVADRSFAGAYWWRCIRFGAMPASLFMSWWECTYYDEA